MPAPKGNQYAVGNSGNPDIRVWKKPEDMWKDYVSYKTLKKNNVIDDKIKPLPVTIEGLCSQHNISRMTFYRYKDYTDEKGDYVYCDTIARIEQDMEQYINEMTAIGAFDGRWFNLYAKNKFGYREQTEIHQDGTINIIAGHIPRPQLEE